MAKFKTLEIAGGLPALHGMRHPLQSYQKSDSYIASDNNINIGLNDYDLAKRLIQTNSPEHAKFLRMINVGVDITADRGWGQEYSTYKIGTTENSQSTMHTFIKTGIQKNDIDFPGGYSIIADESMEQLLNSINDLIDIYKNCHDKETQIEYFRIIKKMIPEGYMQTRTCHLNYQVLRNMYHQRKNHKLPQWNKDFVSWIYTLPYSEFITQQFDKN